MKTAAAFASLLLCVLLTVAGAISPAEAINKMGKTATVEGVPDEVSFNDGVIYLNFGGKFPNNIFVALTAKESFKEFDLLKLKALEGKKVKITGKVQMHNGKPAIVLTRRGQISTDEKAP